jgi:hypothetical protein
MGQHHLSRNSRDQNGVMMWSLLGSALEFGLKLEAGLSDLLSMLADLDENTNVRVKVAFRNPKGPTRPACCWHPRAFGGYPDADEHRTPVRDQGRWSRGAGHHRGCAEALGPRRRRRPE